MLLRRTILGRTSSVFIMTNLPISCQTGKEVYERGRRGLVPPRAGRYIRRLCGLTKKQSVQILRRGKSSSFSFTIPKLSEFHIDTCGRENTLSTIVHIVAFRLPRPGRVKVPSPIVDFCGLSGKLILIANPTKDKGSAALTYLISGVGRSVRGRVVALRSPVRCLRQRSGDVMDRERVGISARDCIGTLHTSLQRDPSIVLLNRVHSCRAVSITVATTRAKRLMFSALRAVKTTGAISHVVSMFPTGRRERVTIRLSVMLRTMVSRRLIPAISKGRIPMFRVVAVAPTVHGVVHSGGIPRVSKVICSSGGRRVRSVSFNLLGLCGRKEVATRATLSCTSGPRVLGGGL